MSENPMLGSPARSRKEDSMVLMDPFQLEVLKDSVLELHVLQRDALDESKSWNSVKVWASVRRVGSRTSQLHTWVTGLWPGDSICLLINMK